MGRDIDTSFPIVGARNGNQIIVRGTAFYIGEGILITAGHCISPAENFPEIQIGLPGDEDYLEIVSVVEVEELEGDVGLIKLDLSDIDNRNLPLRKWKIETAALGSEVMVTGYAVTSFDEENPYSRTFRSALSANRNWKKGSLNMDSYELMHHMPVGISGAALEYIGVNVQQSRNIERFPVIGIIQGNSSTDTEILRDTYVDFREGKSREYVEIRHETAHFGIAAKSSEIVKLSSTRILNGRTIGDHLNKLNLLIS